MQNTTTPELYIPPSSVNFLTKRSSRIILGIQGEPGTGKTTAAGTFPNCVYLNMDGEEDFFVGKDIPHIPIYDYAWVVNYGFPPTRAKAQPNRRDAILKFLQEDAMKLTPEQTLVYDSWTRSQTFFDQQQELEPKITKEGKVDEFDFWGKKIDFSEKVMTYLHSCKCNVVVIFHESKVRDIKSGQLLEKTAPLMQGKFVAQLKAWFPNYFRAVVNETKDKEGKVIKSEYLWQIKSDNQFDVKCKLAIPDNVFFVKPSYEVFETYKIK